MIRSKLEVWLVCDDTVRVAVAVPLLSGVTAEGWIVAENPMGGWLKVNATLLAKLSRLNTVIVEDADSDADTVKVEGLAEIAKSGAVGPACTASPIDIQASTTVSLNVTGKLLIVEFTTLNSTAS